MMAYAVALMLTQAAPSAQFTQCMSVAEGRSMDMLQCGRQEIDRWDARLNSAYQRLMRTLPAAPRARLRTDQRRWLARHRRQTARLASNPNNGSAAFLDSQSFELADLSARTVELEQRLARGH